MICPETVQVTPLRRTLVSSS